MTLIDRIFEETKDMPENAQQQVLDFALFLKAKQRQEFENKVNELITNNLEAFTELVK